MVQFWFITASKTENNQIKSTHFFSVRTEYPFFSAANLL